MELTWLITALLCIVILYFINNLLKARSDYFEKQGVPHIKSLPLVGSMGNVIMMRKGVSEIVDEIYKKLDKEKFGGYFMFTNPIIMLRDPDLINEVLIKDFVYFEDRVIPVEKAKDLMSLTLSHQTGDRWRNARHKVAPTFTSGKLKAMFGTIKNCTKELVNHLNDKTEQDLEARELVMRLIFNVIGKIAFGLKVDTLNQADGESKEFYEISSAFFKPSLRILIKIMFSICEPKLREFLGYKLMDTNVENFFKNLVTDIIKYREGTDAKRNDFVQSMIDLKKKEKEMRLDGQSSVGTYYQDEPFESEDNDIMDQLKQTPIATDDSSKSETFTDDFIAALTFSFISAGSDTVAASLAFVLYELAVNNDLQKIVQHEIADVLSSQELNYETIKQMTYMDRFINETFRLHPVTPTLTRVCVKDYKIPGSDFVIRKGNFVTIPVVSLHKDPQYFPDPEKFDPDRFKSTDEVPKGVYLPFGGGPRICMGKRLALLEIKTILTVLLSEFSISLSEKTRLPLKLKTNSFTVNADGGILIKFHKRNT